MKADLGAKHGDLILILSGDDAMKTRKQLNELRLEMGNQLGLRDKNKFALLWIVDFPMFEWSEEEGRLMAMHHPFTHPKDEDIPLLDTNPSSFRADAYDMVCNGIEVGGGSIRIHDAQLQAKMFEILGFTPEKAEEQFGFLMIVMLSLLTKLPLKRLTLKIQITICGPTGLKNSLIFTV